MAEDDDGYPWKRSCRSEIWFNHVASDFIRATIRDKLSVPDEQINYRTFYTGDQLH